MSERLTDDRLTELVAFAERDAPGWQTVHTDLMRNILSELRERRARDLEEPHMVKVARVADAMPINQEAERMVDAMMAKAIAAQPSRKLTMPALTDEEREALAFARDCVNSRLRSEAADHFSGEYLARHMTALAVIDKLKART